MNAELLILQSPCGLNAEVVTHISNGEPLAINGAEADPPISGVTPGQLWDVVRRLPGSVGEAPEIVTTNIRYLQI